MDIILPITSKLCGKGLTYASKDSPSTDFYACVFINPEGERVPWVDEMNTDFRWLDF